MWNKPKYIMRTLLKSISLKIKGCLNKLKTRFINEEKNHEFKSIHLDEWFQEWDDINLAWNKSEYDDIVDIRLPPKYIWKPDLLMYNRYNNKKANTNKN